MIMNSNVMDIAKEGHREFHVLAVDDSTIDRKLIETLLKISSYQVTAVDSGSKALHLLGLNYDHHHHDEAQDQIFHDDSDDDHDHEVLAVNLIITDYCMPEMTGYDLLRKIKESKSLKDIPVVIMSSENEPSRINRCLEDGAEEFFLKPVRLSDVNKLRPHLLKGKSKDDQPSNIAKGRSDSSLSSSSSSSSEDESIERIRRILYKEDFEFSL